MVTPPGAHPGVPTGQAHPTRRTRGTQHPHGPVAPPPPLTPDVKRRGVPRPDPDNSGFSPVEIGGMGNTHTHTYTYTHTHTHTVAARFVA